MKTIDRQLQSFDKKLREKYILVFEKLLEALENPAKHHDIAKLVGKLDSLSTQVSEISNSGFTF